MNPEKIIKQLKHKASILVIYHFPSNEADHYISLSSDGELREWNLLNNSKISTTELPRPADDLLTKNNHKLPKLKIGQIISITKAIIVNNIMYLGYVDGLISVWKQDV